MNKIIEKIFNESGFKKHCIKTAFNVYSRINETAYWVVIEKDNLDISKEQNQIFNSSKKIVKNIPNFDKNVSLLLLYKHSENIKELDSKILEIEEDPYQFKKQVLVYNEEIKNELQNKLKDSDLISLISNQENFEEYKKNHKNETWLSLLYRIAQKLPFIEIQVEKNKNLSSLFKDNEKVLADKNLSSLNNEILESFNDVLDIKDMDNDSFIDRLLNETEKKKWDLK